ncbi:MAG: hypothetical protein AAF495_08940 [Pseudomonadota bacterium]
MTAFLRALLGSVLLTCAAAATSDQSFAGAPNETATEPADPLVLKREASAATPDQRVLLKYLVSCALPKGVRLRLEVEGQSFHYAGALGLAPQWAERGLTTSEQRWVSACILARTNFFGKEVAISMRARGPAPGSLQVTPMERARFTLAEGAFFGNIFAEPPVAYTCSGARTPNDAWKDRVCAEPTASTGPGGQTLTRCGFIHVGTCPKGSPIIAGSDSYSELIFVYLKPSAP